MAKNRGTKKKQSKKSLKFSAEVVMVNVALAINLLGRMITQREVNKDQMKVLVNYIVNKEWYNLGDPIRLFGDLKTGRVLDGQHRLLALVDAVVSEQVPEDFELPLVFVYYCDDRMEKIDVLARPRKFHEALQCAGYTDVNSKHVAVIKKIFDQRAGGNQKYTPDAVEQFWAHHHSLVKFCTSLTMGGRKALANVSNTTTAAAIFNAIAYGEMSVESALGFFEALYHGYNDKDNKALRTVHALRDHLITEEFNNLGKVRRMDAISAACQIYHDGNVHSGPVTSLVPNWKKLKEKDGSQMIPTTVVVVKDAKLGVEDRTNTATELTPSRDHPTAKENFGRYVKCLRKVNDKAKSDRLDDLIDAHG